MPALFDCHKTTQRYVTIGKTILILVIDNTKLRGRTDMTKQVKHVRIDAPKEKVWEILADFGGPANWAPTITSSNLLTDANGGIGARRTCGHISGAAIEEVITEWEEGEYYSYEMTTSLGPVKTLLNTWAVRAEGNDTVVTLSMDFKMRFGPLGLLMIPMAKMMMGKEMKLSLAGLKHHVETSQVIERDHPGLPVAAVA